MKNEYEKFIDLMFNFDEKEMKREITILELITEKNEIINNLQARIDKAKMFIDTKCVKGVVLGHIYNILEGSDSNE